ncbi:unnamed protein product [Didymodactylos carnosus]|uniref:Uncharacterized protein n=1 Tax=Didymodactylos carnosus TaxID=1234261 RepID=A0A813ZQX0_9BILA|nr:unnamed protein product [Didymodactylos carnosus]CAF0902206.1 unnamed protein product [Didymodactylos carnosus]CAF3669360.1 unnamed protein product [Didymodactylos carnosus]CAF3684521.1 unnamed protein product [Didymodactylos carnosus]
MVCYNTQQPQQQQQQQPPLPSPHHLQLHYINNTKNHLNNSNNNSNNNNNNHNSISDQSMALTESQEAYIRLANYSMKRSEQLAPTYNIRSPRPYGGYVVSVILLEF